MRLEFLKNFLVIENGVNHIARGERRASTAGLAFRKQRAECLPLLVGKVRVITAIFHRPNSASRSGSGRSFPRQSQALFKFVACSLADPRESRAFATIFPFFGQALTDFSFFLERESLPTGAGEMDHELTNLRE